MTRRQHTKPHWDADAQVGVAVVLTVQAGGLEPKRMMMKKKKTMLTRVRLKEELVKWMKEVERKLAS